MGLPDFSNRSKEQLRQMLASIDAAKKLDADLADLEGTRKRCQSFYEFVEAAWPVIEPGTELVKNWHLEAMCSHLQAISEGRLSPWLIINVPPGSSKSTIVAVLWQAWEWGPCGKRHLRFVSTSFEEGNVKRDTRKCRDLILSHWYQTLWPEVQMVRAGETSFANSDTGTREGVAFGAITGKRGDRVVIDDPHSLKGAESETERNNTIRLFLEGGLNRTNDALKSAMVVVMQRLHENDLTGALLAKDLGFIHLMIPMEFEVERRCSTPLRVQVEVEDKVGKPTIGPGKPKLVWKNWTDPRHGDGDLMDVNRFPKEAVERQQKAGEYSWAGQYQQRPAPREGGLFKIPEDWALSAEEGGMVVDACPGEGQTVSGWDFAGSTRKTSPYSVRVKMTRLVDGRIFIRHVDRRRTSPAAMFQMVRDLIVEDGPGAFQDMPQDPGQAGKSQKWELATLLEGLEFRITPETGDKETRALPFAAQVEVGKVFLVRGEWNAAYVDELRTFPAGSYKDQVDASSRAYAGLLSRKPIEIGGAPEVRDLRSPQSDDPRARLQTRSSPQSTRDAQLTAWDNG